LLIVVGLGFGLIKMLTMDLKLSEQERNIRSLTQRLAILEGEMYSRPDQESAEIQESLP
jgi:hypothetical protein